MTRRSALQRGVFLCLNCLAGATSREHLRIRQNEVSWPSITDAYRSSKWASRPGPAALYSGLKPLPEPGAGLRASRDDRSRRSAAAVGQHPSLSGAPRERCPLAPRNAAYRAAGPLGCAGRMRDPLARSPAAPARIPPPAPPVSPTGRGHGEALTPPETRETEHDQADQPQARRDRGGERDCP